jgi:hypothetical protein
MADYQKEAERRAKQQQSIDDVAGFHQYMNRASGGAVRKAYANAGRSSR